MRDDRNDPRVAEFTPAMATSFMVLDDEGHTVYDTPDAEKAIYVQRRLSTMFDNLRGAYYDVRIRAGVFEFQYVPAGNWQKTGHLVSEIAEAV